MPAMTKVFAFTEDLAEGVHDFDTHAIKIALCNAANAPTTASALLASLTTVSTANLTTSSGVGPTTGFQFELLTSNTSGGIYKFIPYDLTITAGPGAAAFRYIVVYNDGTAVKTDPIIGYLDYGSDLPLGDGESLVIDIGVDGLFSIQ